MTLKRLTTLSLALALGGLSACASTDASDPSKAAESEAPIDGKLDGLAAIDHHSLVFSRTTPTLTPTPSAPVATASASDELNRLRRAHAWQFELSGEADIELSMTAPGGASESLDTVMYLYRKDANGGWGRYIRRNDDDASNTRNPYLSGLDEGGLGEGEYRIVIKGYNRSEAGEFTLNATCVGHGCVLGSSSDCFDGEDVTFVQENARYTYDDGTPITQHVRTNQLLTSQILTAVRNHAALLGDNVQINSVSDARAYVDRDSLEKWSFIDNVTGRWFTVIDFTMGDTVVGSVFESGTSNVVATVNDGQFLANDGETLCE